MAVRSFTCPRDNASFKEQDAARLCIHCNEPFLPKICQVNRCSNCGTEGKNGRFACECTNGRLEVSGYRCPNCRIDGGEEMLGGQVACPYCFHALQRSGPPLPQPPASKPVFSVRRLVEIAALCLIAAATAAAAYKYGAPLIHRWLEPAKNSAPNPQANNQPPGQQKPPAGHAAGPQEPGQQPVEPAQTPDGGGSPGGPPPEGQPVPGVTPAAIASFTASEQTIQRGSSTTLHWQVTGDDPIVTLLPGIGAVPPTGAWEVSPETTQQYTLAAMNRGESNPQTQSIVIVVVPPQTLTIVSFTAESSQLQFGQATSLHWIVLGASRVRIDPGIGLVGASGSATVRPQGNTVYVLTAFGLSGTKTAAIPIGVAAPSGPNQTSLPPYGRDLQAMQLLSAVQNAMGGKRNLEAIHGWQRADRVTWEINRETTAETTTFIAPSEIRIVSQGVNTTVDYSNGVAGWTWSSTNPVRSPLPAATATAMPFHELPALLLSDDDPQRTVTLAAPSTLLITDKRNDRVFLRVDPSTHLPEAITWMNLDGAELEETYSDWRQYAGMLWWRHRVRSRNHQPFLSADVTNLQVN